VAVLVATVAGVLALNLYQTQQFAADAAAAQTIARAQVATEKLGSELRGLRLVLGEGGAAARPIEKLRAVHDQLGTDLDALAAGTAIGRGGEVLDSASLANAKNADALRVLGDGWKRYSDSLTALFDVDANNSEAVGQKLAFAIVGSRAHGDALAQSLESLAGAVDQASGQRTRQFRLLQVAGLALAGAIFLMLLFQVLRNLRSEDDAIAGARRETEQILKTVGEGLFLLDRQHRIGSELSDAMKVMFRRESFDDLTLESLLREIVPEKTLRTAMDFVELLWGDRVNEKLVKTLNPLNEVGVHFALEGGEYESRYLAFDFNRVRVNGKMTQLLVTVNDITEKVLLARELQESQAQQQAQLDLLFSILHVEAGQLAEFLANADSSMNLVNTVLKMPARDEASFREKLDKIFREVHSMKSDAAALGLPTVEQKAHVFEDALSELRHKSGLTGNDFLPLAVKLDDLFNHLASVKELVGRLGEMRGAFGSSDSVPTPSSAEERDDSLAQSSLETAAPATDARTMRLPGPTAAVLAAAAEHAGQQAAPADGKTLRLPGPTAAVLEAAAAHAGAADGRTLKLPGPSAAVIAAAAERAAAMRDSIGADDEVPSSSAIETHLRQLAENVATNQGKHVSLVCMGLESVPESYERPVRDLASQMVRNAVVHGVEPPDVRLAAGKPEQGTIVLEFIERGSDGFELVFQDDGAGIDVDRIRAVAVERGMLSKQAAEVVDPRKLIGLIFRAGFSTAKAVDKDAGRGVGLDVVHDLVTKLGGRVGVASKTGEYTRFRVKLPADADTQAA
jgi:HPt (histidine-containing phosphotransfer) domain-containing protein